MRLHLNSYDQLYREFPDLVGSAADHSGALRQDLVAELIERAGPAFANWHPEPLGEQEVRASVGIALMLAQFDPELLPELTTRSLYRHALEQPGLQENHIIGAALFDKPVAGPLTDLEDAEAALADSDISTPGVSEIQALLATEMGRRLLTLLIELLRRESGGSADGPRA